MGSIIFWETPGADGWALVKSIHESPHRLSAEVLALGLEMDIPAKPAARDGWLIFGWVHPADKVFEWRQARDSSYRVPVSDFLAMIPGLARIKARGLRETDPVMADLFALLEMTAAETTSRGVNPHGRPAREGLGYMVSIGILDQADADRITDRAHDP